MNEKIKKHINLLFQEAPKTRKAMDLKEEMLQNTMEKYQDLLKEGYSEEDAFQNVISSIGDVSELFEELEEKNLFNLSEADRRKKAMLTAVAVGLYIFAGIAFFFCVMLEDVRFWSNSAVALDFSLLGLILAGAICIIPTCMLVYAANMYPVYHKKEENMVENYKESKCFSNRSKAVKGAVSTIIWTLVISIYFLVSFLTMAWYVTWVIFLIGACIQAVTELIFSLKKED